MHSVFRDIGSIYCESSCTNTTVKGKLLLHSSGTNRIFLIPCLPTMDAEQDVQFSNNEKQLTGNENGRRSMGRI